MNNRSIYYCDSCNATAGRSGCYKHGQGALEGNFGGSSWVRKCSKCGSVIETYVWEFCPKCGEKLK